MKPKRFAQNLPAKFSAANASLGLRRVVVSIALSALLSIAQTVAGQGVEFEFDASGNLVREELASNSAPQILGQPQTVVAAPGELVSFSVVLANPNGVAYEWRFNGIPLGGGATNDTLLILNANTNSEGPYSVVVSNNSGSVTSSVAQLYLDTDGDGLPDSWELTYFGSLTNQTLGDFDGDGVSNLDEFHDSTIPTNSMSAFFRLTATTDDGFIDVVPLRLAYTNGETVTVTATAFSTNAFNRWTGSTNYFTNTLTLTMDGNKSLQAHYHAVNFAWTNLAGGDWNTPGNWEPNLLPTRYDNAIINQAVTVTVTGSAECGGLNLGSAAISPTLAGTGTLLLHGVMNWQNGTLGGNNGKTVIAPEGTLNLINSAAVTLRGHTLENGGTVLWTGAGNLNALTVSGFSAVLTNRAGALFEVRYDQSFYRSSFISADRFDNAGTLRKSGGTGTTSFSGDFGVGLNFNNYGAVEIQSGTLSLSGNGTHTGSFEVPLGTTLVFQGGTHTAGATSSLVGAGRLTFSGASGTLAGLVNITGTNLFSSGSATLTGNYIYTNTTLNIFGGALNFSGTGVAAPGVVSLTSGTLGGSSAVTVSNVLNWTGGTIGNGNGGRTVIAPGSTLNLANAAAVNLNGHTLENGGTVLWTGTGNLNALTLGGYSAIITNRSGALFEMRNDQSFYRSSFVSVDRFDNAGTLRKTSATGTTSFNGDFGLGLTFNNYGAVEMQTGTLLHTGSVFNNGSMTFAAGTTNLFSGGGSASGSFTVPAAGAVEWQANTFTLNAGAQLNGNGLYRVSGTATLTCNGTLALNNLDLLASLNGSGMLTVSNVFNWMGGAIGNGNGGRMVIAPGATLNLANSAAVNLNGHTLENAGTALWIGSANLNALTMNGYSAVITNRVGALFEVRNDQAFYRSSFISADRFDNAGIWRKTLGTGTTSFSGDFGIGLNFNNYGAVEIRSGIVAATGGYTWTSGSMFSCTLAGTTPGTGYGQLQLGGAYSPAGSLRVELTNGFTPAQGSSFTLVSGGTRGGTFGNFYYPSNALTMQLSNTANAIIVLNTGPYFQSPSQLPDAARFVGYTQQIAAVAGPAPVSYALTSGSLPAGLALSSAGLIHGVPTTLGSNNFSLRITDASGATNQQVFSLRVGSLPAPGLISWWRAENNVLDTIGTNHGSLVNGATHAVGKVGQSFALDGVNDYVNVPDSPSLRPPSVTLEAWVRFADTNGVRVILVKPIGNTGLDSYGFWLQSGTLYGAVCDNSSFGTILSYPLNPVPNQWYHLAYTFDDATKQQALYANGAQVAAGTASKTIFYDTRPVVIGADIENGSLNFFVNGQIDEPSIYNRALNSGEISAIYATGNAGKPATVPYFTSSAPLPDAAQMVGYTQQVTSVLGTNPISYSVSSGSLPAGLGLSSAGLISGIPTVKGTNLFTLRATDSLGIFGEQPTSLRVIQPAAAPAGLISWWRGEGNALDAAGTNHGTASNGVLYVEAKVGQGFSFDGVNDYVNVPDATNLRPASLTMEAWAKFNGSQSPVFGRSLGSGIHNSYIIWQQSGNINGVIEDATQNGVALSAPFSPAAGQWYHVAYSFDDTTKQQVLYLNGAVVASGQSFRSIGYDVHPVLIGGDIDGGFPSFLMNGGVDEPSIYNRALTTNEIASIYNAGVAGKHILTPFDQWKLTYLGDFYAPDSADPDGDGFSNAAEYIADTNPTNSASYLRITSVQTGPSGVSLQWQGGTLATQYVQRASSLSPIPAWVDIFTNPPPTANTVSYTNSAGTNTAQFYRIRVVR